MAPERSLSNGATGAALLDPGPLGDFNQDGVANALDSVEYLKNFGIGLDTYGVTDDVFNPDPTLLRRIYDWQVFDLSEYCLGTMGVNREAFPAHHLPGITTMVDNYRRMPLQYLRELGRRGYTISLFDSIGRLAKRWGGGANGYVNQMSFFHAPGGYAGKIRFVLAPGVWSYWEELSNITFDESTGALTFRREDALQWFTGTLDLNSSDGLSIGSTIAGTFQQDNDATVYLWSAHAEYPAGGTTMPAGDGVGATTSCDVGAQTVGHTGPLIALNLTAALGFGGVHEVGHVIAYMIREQSLAFSSDDSAAFAAAFPGPNQCVRDRSCPLSGSGYVTEYAAEGDEDLAETWAFYVMEPAVLEARIQDDIATNGSQVLANKRAFIIARVDIADPFQ